MPDKEDLFFLHFSMSYLAVKQKKLILSLPHQWRIIERFIKGPVYTVICNRVGGLGRKAIGRE